MLVAYFDESGTHGKRARATTVAGLLGDSIEWSRLELPWKKVMGDRVFHATACASQAEYEELSVKLAELIATRRLMTIGGCVYRDDWNYAASERMKAAYPTLYHFCLAMVLLQVSQLSRDYANNDPVAFIFAKQGEYDGYSEAIHDVFNKSSRWANVGHLGFGKPECLIPLQAADLYSHENYKELEFQLDHPNSRQPPRKPFQIIDQALPSRNRIGAIEFLHRYSDAMDEMPEEFFSRMGAS